MAYPINILVVEDDKEDRYLLARQLQRAQIDDNVVMVKSGREAFDFLERAESVPMAIFLDIQLPGMNGVEVLEKLKRDPRYQSVPVIIMTGSINPDELKRCRKLGVLDILAKPLALTSFIKIIAHIFPTLPAAASQA